MGTEESPFSTFIKEKGQQWEENEEMLNQPNGYFKALDDSLIEENFKSNNGVPEEVINGSKYTSDERKQTNRNVTNRKLHNPKLPNEQQLIESKERKKGKLKRKKKNTICLLKSQNLRNLIFKEETDAEPEIKTFDIRRALKDVPTENLPQRLISNKKMNEMDKCVGNEKENFTKYTKIISVKKNNESLAHNYINKNIESREETLGIKPQICISPIVGNEPGEECYNVEIDKSKFSRIQKLFLKANKGNNFSEIEQESENHVNNKSSAQYNMLEDSTDNSSSSSSVGAQLDKEEDIPKQLNNKLNIFNNLIGNMKPCRSYNMDISHPLYSFLCKNENSYLSSNWHDRINYAFRNIWTLRGYMHDEKSEGEREKEFFNELELFHMSSKIGACGLIYSLFLKNQELENSSVNYFKKCFVQVSKERYPHIYKIYKPKFDDDLVFLFDSLVFTVILGSQVNNINYNTARKIYSNDMKGKNALCECIFNLKNSSKFALPIASQIDFMGMRVISEPLMPLNESYPPVDIIKDIFRGVYLTDYKTEDENEFFKKRIKSMDSIYSPGKGPDKDDEFCSKNLEKGNNLQREKNCTYKNKRKGLKQREYLKRKKEKVFYERLFLEMENYDPELYEQLKQMSDYMNYHCCILPLGFSNYYECKIFKKRNNVKIYKSHIDNMFIVRGAEEILPPFLLNSTDMSFNKRIRYEFIKYYYEHSLCNTTLSIDIKNHKLNQHKNNVDLLKDASKECLDNIENYILPKIVNIVTNFSDSFDITEVYHSHGVNMSNLGYLLNNDNKTPEFLTDVICRELICRTLKCIFYEKIHSFLMIILKKGKRNSITNCRSDNYDESNTTYYDTFFKNDKKICIHDKMSDINRHNSGDNECGEECTYEECNKFICFCENCFTQWDYFPELIPHKLLIRLINLTLNIRTVDSIKFWHKVLIPECIKKFQINLNDHIKIKEMEIYGLLVCIEHHIGVYFKNECKKNYKVRLPLTLDDMSNFFSDKEKILFPNVCHLREIFELRSEVSDEVDENTDSIYYEDSYSENTYNNYEYKIDPSETYPKRGITDNSSYKGYISFSQKSTHRNYKNLDPLTSDECSRTIRRKERMKNNCNISCDSSYNGSSNVKLRNVYSLVDKMNKKKYLILGRNNRNKCRGKKREVSNNDNMNYRRGNKQLDNFRMNHFVLFYPNTKGCFPKYSTWSYRTREKLFSLHNMLQEKFKIKNMLKENIVNIIYPKENDFLHMNNICTVGSCNKIKSFVYEYNIPCHPYCILNEKMKCINYVRAKKCIYLLLNFSINKNIIELSKRFLFLAYLHFEHGYIKKCLNVCYYIYKITPNIGTIRRDILILILQCKVKEGNIEDALIIYKLIVIFNKFYDGDTNSISTLLCNVLLACYYYDIANERKEKCTDGKSWKKFLDNASNAEGKNDDPENYETENYEMGGENITNKNCTKKDKMLLDQVDYLELKKKHLFKALHYSEECYRTISTTMNDISSHYICIFSLILQGNILMDLNKFKSAIKYYTLSIHNCERAKLPNFLILQNKCLLAVSLKNNGNFDKAIEITEDCLKTLSSSTCSSRSLTLYIIYRLAEMKQYIGCRDLIYPNISLDNVSNAHIKKKITTSDFLILEKNYLNEKNKKYRKEAIELYIKLYEKLKSQKNYNLVFAKDIFGCYYTKDDLLPSSNKNEDMGKEDMEKIFIIIREILKIKVISLSMKKQFMLASKLLGIILSKNSSPFVKNLTLMKKGGINMENKPSIFRNLCFDECNTRRDFPTVTKREDCFDNTWYKNNSEEMRIDEILDDIHLNHKGGNRGRALNLQLSNFHQNTHGNFFHRNCYTREYDYVSIEKILFDDTYFTIDDICKYCYSKCNIYNNKQKMGTETNYNCLLNPSIWFDLLFFSVMKGTCGHTELILLIDLVKFFLTPLQKQLILFHVKSLSNITENEQYSEYIQYLLNNEGNKILNLTNILDKEKKSRNLSVNLHPELSNFHKEHVVKNVDFLSNIIVTNPWFFSPSSVFDSSK